MAGRIWGFSYSKSQVTDVVRYINQEQHHKQIAFLEEYKKFLRLFEIDWDEQYIFRNPNSAHQAFLMA
jgi:hypothetical protein